MSFRVVGKIIGYHGLKGEIKVLPLVDHIDYYSNFEKLKINSSFFNLNSYRQHKNFILISLESIDSRTKAEELNGYIEAELEEELNINEIYIQDMIGLKVLNQNDVEIGSILSYSDIGQKLIGIKFNPLFSSKNEILVPFVDEYIIEIAEDKSYIKIYLSEDLMDLAI